MPPDKALLGTRYVCFKCGAKFYDLNKPEPLCPACGADQRENPEPDPREAFLAKFKTKGRKGKRASDEEAESSQAEFEEDFTGDEDDLDSDAEEDEEDPFEGEEEEEI